ncbi:MAG: hypothetical protein WDN44_12255 [Sphingomonas sp.]
MSRRGDGHEPVDYLEQPALELRQQIVVEGDDPRKVEYPPASTGVGMIHTLAALRPAFGVPSATGQEVADTALLRELGVGSRDGVGEGMVRLPDLRRRVAVGAAASPTQARTARR